jgi:hypothetical protein
VSTQWLATESVYAPAEQERLETASGLRPGFKVIQPATTYTGAAIEAIQKGLPKQTQSLCPECTTLIDATIFAEGGKVTMAKHCPEHGDFRDIVFSDVQLYLKMEHFVFGDNRGIANPAIEKAVSCPDDCGMCGMHTSHTGLANVDLTNRCNLTCPVCFANANVAPDTFTSPELTWSANSCRRCGTRSRSPAAWCSSPGESRRSTRSSSRFSP